MQFPGPVRAVVGLLANAADEAKHLPDRAIELPMLAVSTALQMSLRAQQRYARLAARGDQVLNRRPPSEDPPPWATFDDPVSIDELRHGALSAEQARATSDLLDGLLGVTETSSAPDGPGSGGDNAAAPSAEPAPEPPVQRRPAKEEEPATKAPAKKAPAKAPAKKAPAKKAAAQAPLTTTTPSAAKAAAKKSGAEKKAPSGTAGAGPAERPGKAVSKPRHTAPSRFDAVDDDE